MRVVLRVNAGRNAGQEIPVRVQRFLIGRADDCHLRANSTQISRYHCAVIVEESQVWVRDYGSRNGTFVQGTRIAERCRLNNGDLLQVGPLNFVVVLQEGPAAGHDTQPSAAGETSAAGKLRSTLRALGRPESTTEEVEILEILSEPVEPQKAPPLPPTDLISPPPEAPPEEPKTPPKPSFRPPQKVNPADAAEDGLKRLFKPKKQ